MGSQTDTLMEPEAPTKSDSQTLPSTLQYIVDQVIENKDNMSPELARKIFSDSGVAEEDLAPWADYEHPAADSYGRRLVINKGFFEIMVMSWVPGDVSAIHDHGYTLWGAVKVFGPGEHASFMISDGLICTTSREQLEPGRILAVGHDLVHQLGNKTNDRRFLSLHMYGLYDPEFSLDSVTCNARVVDVTHGQVQRSDGGMFFDLPASQIQSVEKGPAPDFLTWSRNTVEYILRLKTRGGNDGGILQKRLIERLRDPENFQWLEEDVFRYVNAEGHMTRLQYWEILRNELKEVAALQATQSEENAADRFHTYAELYDEVIGKPCLDDFIGAYLDKVVTDYGIDYASSDILSIGCGTGIVEEHMIQKYGIDPQRILGIDVSEAMVAEASKRIPARQQDILTMDNDRQWDITYEGLNVFQYLKKPYMERAIAHTAAITKPGGFFIGDFVTPDHIRWYPHVIRSSNVISLRQPRLLEIDHNIHQESEIINVSKLGGEFRVTNEGRHVRYMPSIWKMRYLFQKVFRGKVDIYDAVSMKPLRTRDDTSPSTRYLIVAQKAK